MQTKDCQHCAWWDNWTNEPDGWCRKNDIVSNENETCEEFEEPAIDMYLRTNKRYKKEIAE